MSSTTPSSNMTANISNLPASRAAAGVTDDDIAVLSRFLVRSTNRKGGLPLRYPRRSLDDNQTSGITHAPLSGTSGFERSRKVMDALVAIAVHNSSQCLALSISIGATVRITIAQNDGVPPASISHHLQDVWKQLGQLANLQRNLRHLHSLPDVLDSEGKSLKAAESHLSATNSGSIQQLKVLKEILHADIHRHCYMKTKDRVFKYLAPCADFYAFYRQTRDVFDPAEVIADIVFYLAEIAETVFGYEGPKDVTGALTDMDWYDLAKKSNLLLQMYQTDTTNVAAITRVVMASWRNNAEVKANQGWRRFDLTRAIEKIVSLTRHIQALVNFAYSPRLRTILERPLDIRPLRPHIVQLPDPSVPRIRHIVEQAFHATPFAQTRRIDEHDQLQDLLTEELDLIRDAVLLPVANHTVHAEYTLLLHHHSETHDTANPPPFQYIAVNKLACFSCWSAYKGYTQATGRIFSLRGSHSKLYFPCCPTTAQFNAPLATAMRAYLYTQLVDLYSEHLNHLQDERNRLTDSTVASTDSHTDNRLPVNSEDLAAARRARKEKEAAVAAGRK